MRNKNKIMIYPCYFDLKRSRRLGRRVPKAMAVQKPVLEELKLIADHLKLDYEIDEDAKHPAAWWDESPGRLLIRKKDTEDHDVQKAKLVKRMAKYLIAVKKKKKEKQDMRDRQVKHAHGQQSHKKYQKPQGPQKPAKR